MVGRGNLYYKTNKYTYNFHNFRKKALLVETFITAQLPQKTLMMIKLFY